MIASPIRFVATILKFNVPVVDRTNPVGYEEFEVDCLRDADPGRIRVVWGHDDPTRVAARAERLLVNDMEARLVCVTNPSGTRDERTMHSMINGGVNLRTSIAFNRVKFGRRHDRVHHRMVQVHRRIDLGEVAILEPKDQPAHDWGRVLGTAALVGATERSEGREFRWHRLVMAQDRGEGVQHRDGGRVLAVR